MHDYTEDERLIAEALIHARHVQDFLFGHTGERVEDKEFDVEEWLGLFQKRVNCISRVDTSHPSARIELRKRILQQAALSIRALVLLEGGAGLTRSVKELLPEPEWKNPAPIPL